MDATVEQIDGYRFVYLLPFGPHEIFVEDTYYSDTPDLDQPLLQQRISAYAAGRGWAVQHESRLESGVLPGGDRRRLRRVLGLHRHSTSPRPGCGPGCSTRPPATRCPTRSGWPCAIAAAPDLSHPALVELTHRHADEAWAGRGFYRALDTMLFRAAEPDRRYQVLERFYRLSPGLIAALLRRRVDPAGPAADAVRPPAGAGSAGPCGALAVRPRTPERPGAPSWTWVALVT